MQTSEFLLIADKIDKVSENLRNLSAFLNTINSDHNDYSSFSIDQLTAAFAAASIEFPVLKNNRSNIDGEYVDISQIMHVFNSILGKHGLKLIQRTSYKDTQCALHTMIIHSSGQWIQSEFRLIMAQSNKENGANLDFHKRHQALSLLGVYPVDSTFDDNGTEQRERELVNTANTIFEKKPKKKSWDTITKEQYQDVLDTIDAYPDIAREILDRYDITTLRDMPKEHFPKDMKQIRELVYKIERR